MNKMKKGTMISKTASFLMCATVTFMLTIQTQTAFASTGKNFYVNGTKVESTEIYTNSGYTFVPGADISKAFGDTVVTTETRLTITQGDKTLVFKAGQTVYTVNDEIKNVAIIETNGVKVPSSTAKIRSIYGKVYVPMEILESELGYDISSDSNNIWVGDKPDNLPQISNNEYSHSNSSIGSTSTVTENMKLRVDNGWVCPQLQSTSTDDLLADLKALQKELEFIQNGQTTTSANFDPINGEAKFVTTSVGTSDSNEFSSILFKGYYTKAKDGYQQKINQINPQVLKFYFPSSWEWIHNEFMSGNEMKGQRFIIDGRDTYFTSGSISVTIHFSKVGGTLGGNLPSSSGTIGSSTTISNGYWEQAGSSWYFKKNDGTYAKGWLKDSGKWYFLDSNGAMKTGWI